MRGWCPSIEIDQTAAAESTADGREGGAQWISIPNSGRVCRKASAGTFSRRTRQRRETGPIRAPQLAASFIEEREPRKPPRPPSRARLGQRNELRGMSVIELRNTKYALPPDWPWLPNPRAGAVCLAVHVTGNLLAPAGLYPSVGHRSCFRAGQLEVIGAGRQYCASPGGPPNPAVIADPGLEPFPEPRVLSPHSS